jgi:hypothetical protein
MPRAARSWSAGTGSARNSLNKATKQRFPAAGIWRKLRQPPGAVKDEDRVLLRRATHILIEIIGGLALIAALVVAFGAWRLSQGPVSIGFLRPYVLDALASDDRSVRLTVQDTVLAWSGWERPLDLRATGVRALDAEGNVVATIPQASLGVSYRALARGLFVPTNIDLIGLRATVLRTEDGRFTFRLGDPGGATSSGVLDSLVATLLAPPDHPLGSLTRVSVTDAKLDIDDRSLGRAWHAPLANIVFSKDVAGIRVAAALDVDFDGVIARLQGEGQYRAADGTSTASVRFSGLSPALIASKFPELKPLEAVKLPLMGRIDAALDAQSKLTKGEITVDAGAGRIEYPELWPQGLEVKTASLRGTLTRIPERLTITELKVDLGALTVGFRGTGARLDDGIAIAGEIDAASPRIDDWAPIWPRGVAEGARAWITANMEHGSVPQAHATLALRLPDDPSQPTRVESLAGTFRVEGSTVHYLRPLPPVVKTSGIGTFDANRITIRIGAGTMKGLSVDEGTVRFTKLDQHPSHVDVELLVRGPLRDPLEVLDSPRFGYMKKLGIDPASVDGRAATRLSVSLPTLNDIPMSRVQLKVAGNLEGVAIRNALMGQDLTDGTLELKLDNGGMDVSGRAKVAGLSSELVWVENFDEKDAIARRYRLKTTLDSVARARLGFDLTPYVTGATPAEIAFVQPVRGASDLQLRLDLSGTEMALDQLGWKKESGRPAEANLRASLVGGKPREISQLSVVAPEFEAQGRIALAADGKSFSRVDLARFRAGATDLRGSSVTRRMDGSYEIAISGPSLYASKLVHADEDKPARKQALPPLAVSLDIGQAWLRSPVPLSNIKGRLVYNGEEWSAGALDATMPAGKTLTLSLVPNGATSTFSLRSNDAGEMLRIFGLYDNIAFGDIAVDATRAGGVGNSWKGVLTMAEFRAVKAPGLAKLLTVASLTGIASILSGEGIYFAKLDMPFTINDEMLIIDKARAVGSELGLTADSGEIAFATDQMKITGTVVPAYTLNSMLGNIPLLGRIFTGSEGSGMFAATYKLEGPMDDPHVSVNPLAMLAPGFLRSLLGGMFSGAIKPGEEMEQPVQQD